MALNIKTEEAHALARELSEMTGESLSEAVTVSIRERRDRIRAAQATPLADRLLRIGRATAERLPADALEDDATAGLYDAQGLPR